MMITKGDLWYFDQVEFKRLQEQVRDVNVSLKTKFKTSAYQVSKIMFVFDCLFVKFRQPGHNTTFSNTRNTHQRRSTYRTACSNVMITHTKTTIDKYNTYENTQNIESERRKVNKGK